MAALITADMAQRVRRAIDLALDAEMLPDEVVTDYLWTSGAEAEVKRRDVSWATYTERDDTLERLRVALACLVGASIALALPAITSLQTLNQRWTRTAFDGVLRAAQLKEMADAAIAQNTEIDGVRAPFTQFVVACGRRGR